MTSDPPTVSGPEDPQPITPTPATSAPSLGGMSGETIVMVSGVLVLGVYGIFGLMANE
jgi:hypothetical protein